MRCFVHFCNKYAGRGLFRMDYQLRGIRPASKALYERVMLRNVTIKSDTLIHYHSFFNSSYNSLLNSSNFSFSSKHNFPIFI